MFCILCLCILLCDTSKASENLTFLLKQSLVLGAMKIKDSVQQITLDLFQNCDVPDEVSVTFDPDYQFVGNWYFAKWLNRVSVIAYWRRYPTAQITHKLRPGFSITRLVAV